MMRLKARLLNKTPSANKMAEDGTKIDIVVSKGAKPAATVKVPDLTKMTPDEAQRALGQVGLKGKQGDDVDDDSVPVGYIASKMKHQTPMPKPAIPSPTTFPKDRKRSRFRMLLVLRKHRQLKKL